jgi:predicted ArsR family transcriptional regulator
MAENFWEKELAENGTERALLDRVRFHGAINLQTASDNLGLSFQTVRKHARRLRERGEIWIENEYGENPRLHDKNHRVFCKEISE